MIGLAGPLLAAGRGPGRVVAGVVVLDVLVAGAVLTVLSGAGVPGFVLLIVGAAVVLPALVAVLVLALTARTVRRFREEVEAAAPFRARPGSGWPGTAGAGGGPGGARRGGPTSTRSGHGWSDDDGSTHGWSTHGWSPHGPDPDPGCRPGGDTGRDPWCVGDVAPGPHTGSDHAHHGGWDGGSSGSAGGSSSSDGGSSSDSGSSSSDSGSSSSDSGSSSSSDSGSSSW